jgi:hypothetical protein
MMFTACFNAVSWPLTPYPMPYGAYPTPCRAVLPYPIGSQGAPGGLGGTRTLTHYTSAPLSNRGQISNRCIT